MSTHAAPATSDGRHVLSIFGSIRPYERGWLQRDVVAGITLAALSIPEVMGYTKIAGTPVINGPEALVAFVGAVGPRPVVRDGAVVIRSMMTLSVAFDHRVVDGAAAAAFVTSIKARLENTALE